ncbi:MAG: tRNA pseudouridine(55) synthase TruB [Spirochaetales bacterium]|nr:tRNA pseudouridine(55) synthase TruB [Spirochaetales bacterium]
MTDINGILLLNKPAGITSFKALGNIKKLLKEEQGEKVKVGHTGTLDRFAEGLLVVLTGKFTKLNPVFTDFDKVYEAEIKFGVSTETLDPEGKITETCMPPDIEIINEKINDFRGKISQRPPIFSAVHVDGERAYKRALRGELKELPVREITIYEFEIIGWEKPYLRCRIHCSKGTYIRSIARDLGKACGSCAHLTELKRLSVGPFSTDCGVSDTEFNPKTDLITGRSVFHRITEFNPGLFRLAEVEEKSVSWIRTGKELSDDLFIDKLSEDGKYAIFSNGMFLACITKTSGQYSYIFVAA